MADELDAVLAFKRFGKQYQGVMEWWPAFAGDGQGNVNTSQANWYLARYPLQSSPTHEVFCDKMNLVDNLRIIVGYTAYHPNRVEVIDVADQRTEVVDPNDNPINPGQIGYNRVPLHWANHQYLGSDQGYVNWRQITPLGVFPTNPPTLSVQVYAGYIPRAGTNVFVNSQVVNLVAHVPTTGSDARYVLISYDSTGTAVVTDGTINSLGFNALAETDIPATPAGNWRSCAIVLYTGQTAIVENRNEIDFYDLRFPEETTAGSITPSQISVGSAQYQYIVTGATPFTPAWSAGFLNITAAKTLAVQNSLTFSGTDGSALTLTTSLTNQGAAGVLNWSGATTLTIPNATGTAALGAGTLTSSTTNDVTVAAHTHAITGSLGLLGNASAQYHIPISGSTPFAYAESSFMLDGTSGGKTVLSVTSGKTLTLTAADDYNLTVPATGTAALLSVQNIFTAKQSIILTNATTNAIDIAVTLGHNSSGTPATGFGSRQLFTLHSDTTVDQDAGAIDVLWNVATHASRVSDMVLSAAYSGGLSEIMRGRGGASPAWSIFGVTPQALPSAYTLTGSVTRTMPTDPSGAYTGIDNAQAGTPYATVADLNTLRSAVSSLIGIVRQLLTDLAGYGLTQ